MNLETVKNIFRNDLVYLGLAGAALAGLAAFNIQGADGFLGLARTGLGAFLALIAPGYALQAAIFPRREDLSTTLRWAISFGLSLAVLPMLALLLTMVGLPIQQQYLIAALAAWILCWAGVALVRRRNLARNDSSATGSLKSLAQWWAVQDRAGRVLAGMLLAAFCASLALSVALIGEGAGGHATEFSIIDSNGLAVPDISRGLAGQPLAIRFLVANREGAARTYQILARDAHGVTLAVTDPVSVEPNGDAIITITLTAPAEGTQQVLFSLMRFGSAEPYRILSMWLGDS